MSGQGCSLRRFVSVLLLWGFAFASGQGFPQSEARAYKGNIRPLVIESFNVTGYSKRLPLIRSRLQASPRVAAIQETHLTAEGQLAVCRRSVDLHHCFGQDGDSSHFVRPSQRGTGPVRVESLNYSGSKGVAVSSSNAVPILESYSKELAIDPLLAELVSTERWVEVFVRDTSLATGGFFVSSVYFEAGGEASNIFNQRLALLATHAAKRKGRGVPYYLCADFQGAPQNYHSLEIDQGCWYNTADIVDSDDAHRPIFAYMYHQNDYLARQGAELHRCSREVLQTACLLLSTARAAQSCPATVLSVRVPSFISTFGSIWGICPALGRGIICQCRYLWRKPPCM